MIRNEVKQVTYIVNLHDEPWQIHSAMLAAKYEWLNENDVSQVGTENLDSLPEGWLKFSSDGTVLVMTLDFDVTWKE
jgi:hypothetical protein